MAAHDLADRLHHGWGLLGLDAEEIAELGGLPGLPGRFDVRQDAADVAIGAAQRWRRALVRRRNRTMRHAPKLDDQPA